MDLVELAKAAYGEHPADVSKARTEPRDTKGTVLYRRATESETKNSDRRARRGAGSLALAGAGLGSGVGATGGLARSGRILRGAGKGALVGGAAGAGLGALGLTSHYKQQSRHGSWTYEPSADSSPSFRRNTMKRPTTLAGAPNPDGEGFYGFASRRVRRLPSD